jgi:predicted nucleic acid-binding protein
VPGDAVADVGVIATLDANMLASGLVAAEGGTIAAIIAAWHAGLFDVALSQHIYDELVLALAQPYFTTRVSSDTIARYLTFVSQRAAFCPITVTVSGVATHPEDDLVLASALSAGADHFVTGDRRFRNRVASYQETRVVSPAEFLSVVTSVADEN